MRKQFPFDLVSRLCPAALFVLFFVSLQEFPLRGSVQVVLGANFPGSSLGTETQATPPDANGSIGPAHYVEFVNGVFAVYNPTNGARLLISSDVTFWQNAGLPLGDNEYVSDPRIIYDPFSGRWFACQIDVPIFGINNEFLLAVSKTSDPTEGWRAAVIPSEQDLFADFPTLGLDENSLRLGADLFDFSDDFVKVSCLTIPKSDLLGAKVDVSRRVSSGALDAKIYGDTPHPVVNLGGSTPGLILSVGSDGRDFLPHNTILLIQVNDGDKAGATFSAPLTITVPPYLVPINPPQPGNPHSEPDNGDARFSARPVQIGNILYAVHGVDMPSPNGEHHAAIRWYKIDAASKTLLQSGSISNELHLFYPAIAANSNGIVVISMNGCSTNQYISSYAAVGETLNDVAVFEKPVLLKAGTATYDNGGIGSTSRWGDYNTLTVDPGNNNHFWAIQSIATAANRWTTQITEIRVTSHIPPPLTIGRGPNNQIQIQWPATSFAFTLEKSTVLTAPDWSPLLTTPEGGSGNYSLYLPALPPSQFFRLR